MGKRLGISGRRLHITALRRAALGALVALVTVAAWPLGPTPSAYADTDHRRSDRISLAAPIDFATSAEPSSAPFNVAAGDQALLLAPNATLGDGVAAGDFNHDGNPDVAQTNLIAGTVSVFLGDGKGGFAPPQMYPVGEQPHFIAAGNLDQDRNPDLAVANFGSGDVAILRGSGDGTFLPASFVTVPVPRNVAIGRFDADDIPDLAVASGGPANPNVPPIGGVTIFTGRGDATFGEAQFIQTMANDGPNGANHVAVGDFDRNGFDDFAVGVGARRNAGDRQEGDTRRTGDDVLIFLNRNRARDASAEQPFSTTPDQIIRVGGSPDAIAVVRLNRDRYPDLAVMGQGSGDITTLLGDRRGRFIVKATNVTLGGIPRSVAAGDLDNDRIQDLVTANFQDSTVSVLKGRGDGTFHPAVDFWAGDGTTGAALGHFDDDHRLDVVAARMRTDQLSLLLNDSPGRGDGVVIQRDIYYGRTKPDEDPLARHHTLDVYSPPRGSRPFGPKGQPYPVVLFVHGGGGVGGDKAGSNYLLRSLARSGIVAVSTNYRLDADEQAEDVAQAFRWVYRHVGSARYRGDPRSIFVFGYSAGAHLAAEIGSEARWRAEQQRMRGVVLAGFLRPDSSTPVQRPSLFLNGTEGIEIATNSSSAAFSAAWVAQGAESEHVTIAGRDHLTLVAHMALADDPARAVMFKFIRRHLNSRR